MALSLPRTITPGTPENAAHVQDNDAYLAAQVDLTNAAVAANTAAIAANTPPAVMYPYAGASAPTGFLLCDGTAVSRSTYSALFAVVGTTYGAGNGTTTFNLPDGRGRPMFGVGTHADVDTLGENEGSAVGVRRAAHVHSLGNHTHPFSATTGASSNNGGVTAVDNDVFAISDHTHSVSGTTGVPSTGSDSANVPYLAINWIIKT